MPLQPVSLGIGSNPDRQNDDGAAVFVNCFAEDAGEEGKARFPVYACDGFAALSTLAGSGAGAVRGMLNLNDTTLYVCTGSRINRVTTAGTATDMAALATSGVAYMARNRKASTPQIAIVTSDGLFRIIENNAVSTPSLDADIPSSLFNSVCVIDGYFVITCSSGEWYITAIDASTIDELDFSTATSNPDGLTRGIVRGRDLCLMGPRSSEFYANTGAADFPFERIHTSSVGIYAGPTAVALTAVSDGATQYTVVWAATNADGAYIGVMMLGGYEARKVSANWVDRAIRDATASTLRAFAYTRNGATFYCVTSSTFTAELNTRTMRWHKRKSSGLAFWRVTDAATFNGQTVFGDYSSAALYQADHAITPGSASVLSMRQSFNNGTSWSSARTAAIGGSGSETTRVKFNRLGQSKEDGRVLELALSNAVIEAGTGNDMTIRPPTLHGWPLPTVMHALHVDVTSGASLTNKSKGITAIAVDAEGVLA
jgi:hypothetical protein